MSTVGIFRNSAKKITEATHAYGYQVDTTSKSKYVTRVGNLDLHRTLPIQRKIKRYVESPNGQFLYWLHPQNSALKADGTPSDISGVDGNVMLYIPPHYFKLTIDANVVTRMFSEFPIPGYIERKSMSIAPWYSTYDNINNRAACISSLVFDINGNIIRDQVTGLPIYQANATQFRGGNNNAINDAAYNSFLGVGRTEISRTDIRNKCAAILSHNGSYQAMKIMAQLFTLEYANYDVQENYNPSLDANGFRQGGLGSGPSVISSEWSTHNGYYPFVPGGVTASLGNNSGVVNWTITNWANLGSEKIVTVPSYRGFENWYEYLWLINDDSLVFHQDDIDGGKVLLYVCTDQSKFANPANDLEPTPPSGYELMTDKLPGSNGYGWNECDNVAGDIFPINTGGSATEGLCDYYYRDGSSRGWFGPLLSASAAYGTYSGSRLASTSHRVTRALASYGFRQCRSNPEIG